MMKAYSIIVGILFFAQAVQSQEPLKNEADRLREAIAAVNRAVENSKKAESEGLANKADAPALGQRAADAAKRLIAAKDKEGREQDMLELVRAAKSRLAGNSAAGAGVSAAADAVGNTQQPKLGGQDNLASPNALRSSGSGKPAERNPGTTAITAEDEAIYSNNGVGIFTTHVIVNRSDLRIWCDRLEVALNLEESDSGEAVTPPDPTKPEKPKPEAEGDLKQENIKNAIATAGPGLVVIWRKTDVDEVLATCREAVYDGMTGDLTLKNRPEVLKGKDVHILGRDDASELILYKSGTMKLPKRPQTTFVQPPDAREIRRRLLSHIPPKSGRAPSSEASDNPTSSEKPPVTPPSTPAPPQTTDNQ